MFSPDVYAARRRALALRMASRNAAKGLVFFPGNSESPANYADNCHPFRQDSSWLYFFGIDEPGLSAVLDLENGEATLFAPEPTMDELVWTGPRPGAADLSAAAGAERFAAPAALEGVLRAALESGRGVRYLPPYRADTVLALSGLLGLDAATARALWDPDLVRAVVSLREIKELREIAELERAVAITTDMHCAVLAGARAGWTEARAAALAAHVAAEAGARLSFTVIATTRGEILHDHGRSGSLAPGGALLLDAGAETASGYAGDLTTTFPVGPKFPPRLADIYRLVLRMGESAVAALAPGRPFLDAHMAASLALAEGLKELGIMKGDPGEAVAAGAHALFFPHGLGHMIGLDVHDMEALGEDLVGYGGPGRSTQFGLRSLRLAKKLEPGMVHSVEPGIYFIPGLVSAWKAEGRHADFIDYGRLGAWMEVGGVRNEEDWLMTPSGGRRLGPEFDKSVEAVEKARSSE